MKRSPISHSAAGHYLATVSLNQTSSMPRSDSKKATSETGKGTGVSVPVRVWIFADEQIMEISKSQCNGSTDLSVNFTHSRSGNGGGLVMLGRSDGVLNPGGIR